MLQNEFVIYTLAIWVVLYLLHYVRVNKNVSAPEFVIHGGIAIMAVVTMILYTESRIEHALRANVILLLVAVIEGLALFMLDLKKTPLSSGAKFIHRLIAVVSICVLAAFALKYI